MEIILLYTMIIIFFIIICLAIFSLVFGLIFGINYITSNSWNKYFEKIANSSGMKMFPGGFFSTPRVSGSYKGLKYNMYLENQVWGWDRDIHLGILMSMPVFEHCNINIYYDDFRIFHNENNRVKTGDPGFDRTFLIESTTPDKAKNLLTQEICMLLVKNKKHIKNIMVYEKAVKYRAPYGRTIFDESSIAGINELMWQLAKTFSDIPMIEDKKNTDKICQSCGANIIFQEDLYCRKCGEKLY